MKFHKLFISFLVFCVISLFSIEGATAQVEFELNPSQSMCITGKGPGQDAAINPFEGEDCLVLVENIGKLSFSVRTQQEGQKNLKSRKVKPGATQPIHLPKGYELYLDTTTGGEARAKVSFEKMNK